MNKGDHGYTSALYVWNGLCVFWGTSFHTLPHSHNTLQLVFDIEKEFLLRDKSSEWTSFSAAVIDANHVHQLDSNGNIQLFMYLDKESYIARLFRSKYLNKKGICSLLENKQNTIGKDFLKHLLLKNNCKDMYEGCHKIIRQLVDNIDLPPLDGRIQEAIAYLKKGPEKSFTIRDVAMTVGLSQSRLRHLFKEQVGQSLQNYILWMRVINALNDVLKGKKLLDVAYQYGFSDPSHMTKSFIKVIGIAPSKLESYVHNTEIITCTKGSQGLFKTQVFTNWSSGDHLKKVVI